MELTLLNIILGGLFLVSLNIVWLMVFYPYIKPLIISYKNKRNIQKMLKQIVNKEQIDISLRE